MERAGNPIPQRRIRGKHEMKALTLATISALEEADLDDEIQELNARVFARSPKLLFETQPVDDDLCEWRFKPIVELVLYEIQGVAAAPGLSAEERRR